MKKRARAAFQHADDCAGGDQAQARYHPRMSTERLHAQGPGGEACIIERTSSQVDTSNLGGRSNLAGLPWYRLGTGERLNPNDDPKMFRSLDGKRPYMLA